ncbi:MAG TPA: glycosyltransferase [Thermoanaerobaculia bacterium]|nr:glycosyltransferase [Thermoanaerobaculia bacterium]
MTRSVIVPCLDSPYVSGTLEGLRAQGSDVEVVVVGRDAHGLVPRDGRVRFLETARPMVPAAARNLGVAEARGERIFFVDADCRPLPGWLAALDSALERVPVAGGAVVFPRGGSRWALADNIASFHELLPDRPAEDDTRRPLGSLNLACTRAAWEAVGPFDEGLTTSEDHDWVLRARRAGLATAFVPAARVEHAAVRASRAELEAHAAWYGAHFHRFRARHPEAFGTGPTWRSRERLARAAPVNALASSLALFLRHPSLLPALRALPAVVAFRRAWYRAVLESWP